MFGRFLILDATLSMGEQKKADPTDLLKLLHCCMKALCNLSIGFPRVLKHMKSYEAFPQGSISSRENHHAHLVRTPENTHYVSMKISLIKPLNHLPVPGVQTEVVG